MKRRINVVSLTGGLGNQLFQLAEGLATNPDELHILATLGRPRTTSGKPDLLHFTLPPKCKMIVREESSKFVQKVSGYVLRKGIKPKSIEKLSAVNIGLDFVANLILAIYLRKWFWLRVGRGVGYSSAPEEKNQLFIGYFQHQYNLNHKNVKELLMKLSPVESPSKLRNFIQSAVSSRPIFVHYRLTDYLKEDAFGTPSPKYYSGALEMLNALDREIWVFSDDSEMAKKIFPKDYLSRASFVDDTDLSPAQALHLFRFGSDYVIANSSFSWWGAALRFEQNCKVIAPIPWFKELEEPQGLIPINWERRSSN